VGEGNNYVEVETVKLDEYFKDKNSRVDVIKMDIEGAEALALEAMQEILSKNNEIKIFSEFSPGALEKSGIDGENYLNVLTNLDFKIYEIGEEKDKNKPNLKLINSSQFKEFTQQVKKYTRPSTHIFCKREG
jgi:hypothetical protein